ncbi:hypothetical protein E6W36_05955 [Hankyongella ginsenosidimutans]|uniref:Squalene synthase HpnD n=1 Tax=Hankyongella ginsenosidimutans TaxID=1763828 RepID=A0A4D7BUM9_9SPHN|nr:hypothetical protein E6W36_05955 [Hankyongella ginsenosidimutans]
MPAADRGYGVGCRRADPRAEPGTAAGLLPAGRGRGRHAVDAGVRRAGRCCLRSVRHRHGEGLQLANIVRDVGEDAAEGRIYLPDDLLARFGLPDDPAALPRHPALPQARAALAADARAAFARSRAELSALDWRVVRPALVMHAVYDRMLQVLADDGFHALDRPKVGRLSKIGAVLRALLWPPAA